MNDTVALRTDWLSEAIVDPGTALTDSRDHQVHVHAVPRELAEEYITATHRLRQLQEQIETFPQYRTVPAIKLMLGNDVVAEVTR